MTVRLALGTVQFGMSYGIANRTGQVAPKEAGRILEAAKVAGIDTLDTAIGYGDSESILGSHGVHGFRIVTKLPPVPPETADVGAWVRDSVAGSCTRLRAERLYAVLLHRSSDLETPAGACIYEALARLKDEGVIGRIGYSIYAPSELDMLVRRFPPDLVQAPYSVLDQRMKTSGWMDRLSEAGVEIHTRSSFLQGLLLLPSEARPPQFDHWREELARWDDWVASNGTTRLEAALGFALAEPLIDRVVVGVDTLSHLREILAASGRPAHETTSHLAAADEALLNPSLWKNQ